VEYKNHITDRNEWYDRNADLPERPETKIKIAPKAKGELAQGYQNRDMPKTPEDGHLTTTSERNSVSRPFKPGIGNQLPSQSSPESFVKPVASKESHAK